MGKLKLTESQFKMFLKHAILEQNEEEYHKISPQDYLDLLELSGYHARGISKLPMFKGKPIWITGKLDVSRKPIDSLGNVKYVDGPLDISDTNISDISGITVKGHIWDGNTPISRARAAAILREKLAGAESRREDNKWDLNNPNIDDEGLAANALYKNLVNDGEISELDEDDLNVLREKESQLKELNARYEESEDTDESGRLYDQISELEDEIEQIREDTGDVYTLIPLKYDYYGLPQFEIIGSGKQYAVGHENIMDDAAQQYARNYIDEVGVEGFNQSFIEDYIDTEDVVYYFKDFYENDIRDNPEVYFSEEDFKLSDEQEERIGTLETYISELEDLRVTIESEKDECESEEGDCDEFDEKLEEIDNNIEEAQDEIDNIEPENEPSEEMIDDKLEDLLSEVRYDPVDKLKEWGMDISDYVDKDALADGLVNSDGYGIMSTYDSSYDTVRLGEHGTFYILRMD
jgi:hypothetical protein